MATWNIKEESGKMYVYCSKNAVSDVLASNHFGKASAWVSGGAYSIGARATSVSIQYRNKTGVNTTTAPASDATNWEFDLDNFQTYNTSKVYAIGSKTNYNNEHYICTVAGSTGTFQTANWTKQIISNRDVPYKLQNTAINLINSDARFVSYELLDIVNNVAYHNIHNILGNGSWNETLTAPTKYIRFIGQSNLKTVINKSVANQFHDNLRIITTTALIGEIIKCNNCIIDSMPTISTGPADTGKSVIAFCFKNIILSLTTESQYLIQSLSIAHFINNSVLSFPASMWKVTSSNAVFKSNYIKGTTIELAGCAILALGNLDYNFYDGVIKYNGVTQTSIAMLQTTLPNQNIYSIKGTTTLNSDYTLPVSSPLIKAGSNGNNIGAEGVGYPQTNSTILDSANGAIYRNVTKYGTTLTRQQISKQAQGGGNNYITLESLASAVNNEYDGFRIYISSGTGAGQTRTILVYNASTKDATVDSNWTINPDSTSIYEILDGKITSAVGDLGSIQTVKKLIIQATNYYDATGYIINQNVSETDSRLDNPSALTYDLRVSNTSDLSAIAYRRFVQDDYLKVDSSDKGCGDSSYNPATIVSSVLTFRYFQFEVMLRK